MKKFVAFLITMVTALVAVPSQAHAYDTYLDYRFKGNTVCVENHTPWFPALYAARTWRANNTSGLWVTAGPDCSSYGRSQTIIVKQYRNDSERACAKTASEGNDYTWQYVYVNGVKKAMWTPNKMTIWVNTSPVWWPGCWSTTAYQRHVAVHEEGHGLGLDHPDPLLGRTVMVQGTFDLIAPTSLDYRRLEVWY